MPGMLPVHVTTSARPRPRSAATIWCDGEAGAAFREGVDLELSHWAPNRTPAALRADTSTEIVLRWAADAGRGREHGAYDLVVNGHVDVDGVLSVWAAAAPEAALPHRETLVAAAEIGDFASWGTRRGFALYQGLALLQRRLETDGADPLDVYERCFAALPRLLAPDAEHADDIAPGLRALDVSAALLDRGDVAADRVHARLVRFTVPRRLAEADRDRALRQPAFNAPLDSGCLLLPHVRARHHEQSFHLVSTETALGWFHDLCVPGYAWADVERRWIAPGLPPKPRRSDDFDLPPLAAALAELQRAERGPGTWKLALEVTPFATIPGREFPVIASPCLPGGGAAPSTIPPADVAARLAPATRD